MNVGKLLTPARTAPAVEVDDTFARVVAQLDRENAVVLALAAAEEKRRARRNKIAAIAAEVGENDE